MRALLGLLGTALVLLTLWGAAALWIDGPESRPVAGALAGGFALASLAALAVLRPFRRGIAVSGLLCAIVLVWWLGLEARNDRDWLEDVARTPRARLEGSRLTIENLRNFEYRSETEYTPRWEVRSFDLDRLTGVDFFLIYWGSPKIAHTIASWAFEDSPPLAISIETRKEKGEEYSAVLGFFRQFELYYVVADERDLIGLRTHYRGEDVYLYRLRTAPDVARKILLDYVKEINSIADHAKWYNALTQNCTTTLRHHAAAVVPENRFDWRILVNGYIDQLGYERGSVDTSLPFEELRRRSHINEVARTGPLDADFSRRIREGLPRPARTGR
jgi:hypothetical protein